MKKLQAMSLVKVLKIPKEYDQYPWKENDVLLCLGEIKNMPWHYAFATRDGKVYWGYHGDFVRQLSNEET